MRRALSVLVIGIVLPMFGSCIFAPKKAPEEGGGPGTQTYLPLTERDNVLHNLDLAYNQRNIEEYRRLLDSTPNVFLFFFSPTDVNQGNVKSSQWDLSQELAATTKLFDRNPPAGQRFADDVQLTLTFSEGEDEWQPYVPSTHPNETWYDKPVSYTLKVRIGLTTYTQNKIVQALFSIRQVNVDGQDIWQIVRWRDDLSI